MNVTSHGLPTYALPTPHRFGGRGRASVGWRVTGALIASAWLFALPVHAQGPAADTCAEAGGQCVDAVDCASMGGLGVRDPDQCPDTSQPICCIPGASNAGGSGGQSAALTDEECRERCLLKVNNCAVLAVAYDEVARTSACRALCSAFSGKIDGASWQRCIGSNQVTCTTLLQDDQWQGIGTCLEGGAIPGNEKPPEPGQPIKLPDPLGGRNLAQIIGQAIRAFTGIAGAIALLMFVYGGVYWIYSKGEGEKVTRAIEIIRNAVIGLVLIFGAYFFTSAIVQGILHAPTQAEVQSQ